MKFLIIFLTLASSYLQAQEVGNARLAIHLLDYLASDYSGAVVNGKIKSSSEYEEQLDFSSQIVTIISHYHQEIITKKGKQLKNLIENKKDGHEVAFLARALQRDLISYSKINFSAEIWPSLKRGATLYKNNCIKCHGTEGFGDGVDAKNLLPLPTNFHNSERMNKISAFHCYNTIRLGVPGTAMVAFDQLDDNQIWDLAFYIMSLPYSAIKRLDQGDKKQLSLQELSILSNDEIRSTFSLKDDNLIAYSRTNNHQLSVDDYLDVTKKLLSEVLPHYIHGDKDNAKRYAIQAYLQGIEPIEPAIKANKPELIISIEISMSSIRKLIELDNHEEDLKHEIQKVETLFQDIKLNLTNKKLSFSVAMLGTFAIVMREGLEAVLLIVTLLGVVGAMKNRKAIRTIHYGWSSALLIGFIMWFISGELINVSGIGREMLEAVTAMLAVIVLLYFGFWLHKKTEINRWKDFIHKKVNNAVIEKSLFTLFSISFMAVFREAFETVLFIRSLWFQTSQNDKHAIPMGLLLAIFLIFILAYFMLRYSKKIPIRKLFQVSSLLMTLLAIILTGKAIHSFQEIGFLSIHTIPLNLRIEILGIFPVWESIIAQGLLMIIMFFLFNERKQKMI
jgi:high-affinity iron transporter